MPLGLGNAKLIEDLTYNTQGFFDPNAKKSMNPITVSEYIELVIKLEFETKAEVGKMNDKQKAALMNGIPKLANDVLQILKKFFRLYFSKKLQQPLKHGILEA